MRKILLLLAVSALSGTAHAQQVTPAASAPAASPAGSPPSLPPGPLLKPIADNTRWTITFTGKTPETKAGESSTPDDAPTRSPAPGPRRKPATTMIGERMGKMNHVTSLAADGTKEEKWSDGGLTAVLHPGAKDPVYVTTPIEAATMPTWISRQNCLDVKTQGEKTYYIFRDRIVPAGTEIYMDYERPETTTAETAKVEATAVIDADTHLPVGVQEGEATITYKYEPIEPGTEIIPEAVRKSLAARGKKMQEALRKPARP